VDQLRAEPASTGCEVAALEQGHGEPAACSVERYPHTRDATSDDGEIDCVVRQPFEVARSA
jgi:hypothetical protein